MDGALNIVSIVCNILFCSACCFATSFKTEGNNKTGILLHVIDITQRKKAEVDLKEEDVTAGRDPQLEKALEILKSQAQGLNAK